MFFFKNPTHKAVEKLIPDPFRKKLKLRISLDQQSEMLSSLFLLCVKVKVYQTILKLRCLSPVFTLYKALLKSKTGSGTSLPSLFS